MTTQEVTERTGAAEPRAWLRPPGLTRVLLAVYAAAAAGTVLVIGVPFDREQVMLWLCGALAITCIGRPWSRLGSIVRDWLPFALLLIAYDYTRGAADTLGMPLHVTEMIDVDRAVGLGQVPTVWLQDRLLDLTQVHWYDVAVTIVYNSHFFAVYIIAAVLWARDRERWRAFVNRFLVLTFAGLATYVLFPAAPPWYAAAQGEIDPVSRVSGRGWSALGLDSAASLLEKGQAVANQVAAMPSLHAAFAAFIAVFFWRRARWPLRVVLATYPPAMGFALVYSGEHYVTDVLVGWIYVAATMLVVGRVERWWQARRATLSAPVPDLP